MKIAHICLSCFYIDGRSYQENELVRQHVKGGHQVLVLASTETHSANGRITYVEPSEYVGPEGALVRRLPYRRFLPHKLMVKLRINVGTYEALTEFRPDAILFHGTCGWELLNVARYVRNHRVPFYVDSHEDWNNSARGFISREILHRRYYGPILRSALPEIRKILCVSTESMDFVADLYRIPKKYLEFFPLGGHPVPDREYAQRRDATRRAYGLDKQHILLVQSGKQTRRKKLLDSLRAIATCQNPKLRFFIVGVLDESIRNEAEALIASDDRIAYLGWKTPSELTNLLCAADVYLQPGTQSVTMQHSLCCRCAVILDDVPAHKIYQCGNGWFLSDMKTLPSVVQQIADANLSEMAAKSFALSCELLDYAVLSKRVLK